MAKLSFQDLVAAFSSVRSDHPGRRGSVTWTRGAGSLSKSKRVKNSEKKDGGRSE